MGLQPERSLTLEHYPLAIYTAEHGLAWAYDREAIPFAALDACRKAFGALPDFDAGEPGFEGVWVTDERVFAVRCQSAPAWDFRGRDATYLAVTWVPRAQAASTNFEALLASPFLCQPMHTPPTAFRALARSVTLTPCQVPTSLPDGFARVGAVVAGLPTGAIAIFRRAIGERVVTIRVQFPSAIPHPTSETSAPVPVLPPLATPTLRHDKPKGLLLPWPIAIAIVLLMLFLVSFAGFSVHRIRMLEQELERERTAETPTYSPCCKLSHIIDCLSIYLQIHQRSNDHE